MDSKWLFAGLVAIFGLVSGWSSSDGSGETCMDFLQGVKVGTVEHRALCSERYCRHLLDKEGVVRVTICVGNRVIGYGRRCVQIGFEPTFLTDPLIRVRAGIHPGCDLIPDEDERKFLKERSIRQRKRSIHKLFLCFDEIPSTEDCCETNRCLIVEADIHDVESDAEVTSTLSDKRCGEKNKASCPLRIDCVDPNPQTAATDAEPVEQDRDSTGLKHERQPDSLGFIGYVDYVYENVDGQIKKFNIS
uniref:Uncharacterized protein n=1 Tax=Rhodosorus marinus TaxID=101924 RepID=A0A7S0BMU7_9RHOD|mmetsp:Transcript_21803/g.31627  ORF Transcript_21803/g.31627 Transcript_21803/m.31627 type:complete len:247 (+) Transcript_21803:70-810(+)